MSTEALTGANRFLERWIIVILPIVLLMGFHASGGLQGYVTFVKPLFIYLTFVSSMNVTLDQFKELGRKPWAVAALLTVFHLIMPIVSYFVLGPAFDQEHQKELLIGALLAAILPIGVTSIVWVSMAQGHTGIAIALVTLDTLLSPLLLPLTLHLQLGAAVQVDAAGLILGVIKLVVIPSVLGIAAGAWLRTRKLARTRLAMSLSSKLTLYLIVLLNAAAMSSSVKELGDETPRLLAYVSGLMLLGYLLSWLSVKAMRLGALTEVALTYSGGVRNYTAGVVIAQLYFSPTAAIPVMFAILLQHPMALLVHTLFKLRKGHGGEKAASSGPIEARS